MRVRTHCFVSTSLFHPIALGIVAVAAVAAAQPAFAEAAAGGAESSTSAAAGALVEPAVAAPVSRGAPAQLALADGPATQSTEQTASSQNAETIVVTGTRAQAKLVKKQANVIIEVAPLEQIRSLPDANAAEALQRLPGISMESDSGAGRYINIRGMDADLNGTTFDGVRMMANNPQTPQGGARAVAFDAFPAGILGGLEVIKSLTPEMDAEGLGGVVNIQPRTIPDGAEPRL